MGMMRGVRKSFIKESHKLSLEQCRKLLDTKGSKYADEEIIKIRDFLYQLAEIDYFEFIKRQERGNNNLWKPNSDNLRLNP